MTRPVLKPGPLHPITVEPAGSQVTVTVGDQVVARTDRALTLREATIPPVHYIPLADVDPAVLVPSEHTSYCPYKGEATYYGLRVGDDVAADVVWTYVEPHEAVAPIADHVAFWVGKVDSLAVSAG
jgi:uncharacterized protein (DUF427 family)